MLKKISFLCITIILVIGLSLLGTGQVRKPFYIYLNDIFNVNVPSPTDTHVLTYDAADDEWQAQASGGGVTTFTALNDTPGSYAGQSGRGVRVNAAPDGLEFYTITGTDEYVGVDTGAVAGYLGAAYNDGVFRVDQNELTYTDGGNFITLGLANHSTARTALGLGTGNDVQFADIYHTNFESTNYYNNGNSGASITINWNNGNLQYVTLTAVGVDITFTEPPHPGKCELWIIQDGTGNRTIDWTHEVNPKFPGGVAPTLSTGANDADVIVFTFIGGTTYRGLFNGDFS